MKVQFLATLYRGVISPLAHQAGRVLVGFSRFKPDEILDVTVERQTKRRTLPQLARYWTLIVPAFAEYCGHETFPQSAEEAGITPNDSAHRVLKALFIGRTKITLPDGTEVEVEPTTKCLTTAQFAELQDQAERLLNANNIYLPAEEHHDR